jgi:hemerythrin
MSLIEWTDELSVGIKDIDSQHKKLVDLINLLNDGMKTGDSKNVLEKIFKELIEYTVKHFSFEENLMKKVSYVSYIRHKKEHDDLAQKVKKLMDDFQSGKIMISIQVRDFLKDWILNHIQKVDKLYTSAFKEKGIN